jgi:hypothetical protein
VLRSGTVCVVDLPLECDLFSVTLPRSHHMYASRRELFSEMHCLCLYVHLFTSPPLQVYTGSKRSESMDKQKAQFETFYAYAPAI